MDIVERNVGVCMVRHTLDNIPSYPLPPDYSIQWYQPGYEQVWVSILTMAERYIPVTPALYAQEFGTDPEVLAKRQCFLLDGHGKALGTATAWFDDNYHGRAYGRLHWVAIIPEAQGRGLAKPLLTAVCLRLLNLQHSCCYLRTSTARIAAINLYIQFGFLPEIYTMDDLNAWLELQPRLRYAIRIPDRIDIAHQIGNDR